MAIKLQRNATDEEIFIDGFNCINSGYKLYTNTSLTGNKIVVDIIDSLKTLKNVKPKNYLKLRFLVLDDFGWFTIKLYKFLMETLEDIIPDGIERKKTVLSNIYVVPTDTYAEDYINTSLIMHNIFDELQGNIINKNFLDLESDMKFDVIIGNPPYKEMYGNTGGNNSCGKSIYYLFIEKAKELATKYVIMITPSRWMLKTANGIPDAWVDEMMRCNQIRLLHDFEEASEIFPDVVIRGGVNYFLLDKGYNGDCEYYFHEVGNKEPVYRKGKLDNFNAGIIVRNPRHYSIINKVEKAEGRYYNIPSKSFSSIISSRNYFGNGFYGATNWYGYKETESPEYNIKYYITTKKHHIFKWVSSEQVGKNIAGKDLWKVLIPNANGDMKKILGNPLISEPNSICSDSFLVIGYNRKFTKEECENVISYIRTKFFRFLVLLRKPSQNSSKMSYQFVPLQDFSKPWTDQELYKKYKLSQEEIKIIEETIKPM